MLTWIRNIGIVRVSAAMLHALGLPADISFLPYSWDLSCRGQLLGGFKVVHSAPVLQPPFIVRSQVMKEVLLFPLCIQHYSKVMVNNTNDKHLILRWQLTVDCLYILMCLCTDVLHMV